MTQSALAPCVNSPMHRASVCRKRGSNHTANISAFTRQTETICCWSKKFAFVLLASLSQCLDKLDNISCHLESNQDVGPLGGKPHCETGHYFNVILQKSSDNELLLPSNSKLIGRPHSCIPKGPHILSPRN